MLGKWDIYFCEAHQSNPIKEFTDEYFNRFYIDVYG
jgi:hypothetical protein